MLKRLVDESIGSLGNIENRFEGAAGDLWIALLGIAECKRDRMRNRAPRFSGPLRIGSKKGHARQIVFGTAIAVRFISDTDVEQRRHALRSPRPLAQILLRVRHNQTELDNRVNEIEGALVAIEKKIKIRRDAQIAPIEARADQLAS